jgi:hypothetical protein
MACPAAGIFDVVAPGDLGAGAAARPTAADRHLESGVSGICQFSRNWACTIVIVLRREEILITDGAGCIGAPRVAVLRPAGYEPRIYGEDGRAEPAPRRRGPIVLDPADPAPGAHERKGLTL